MRRHTWLMLLTTVAVPLGLAGQEPPQAPRHLEQARVMLDRIPEKPAGEDADEKIADLRRHFSAMVQAYAERPEGAPPSSVIAGRRETDRDADDDPAAARDWKLEFSNVERDLAKIIGGGTYSGATTQPLVAAAGSVAPAPVGTVGTVTGNAPAGVPNVVPGSGTPVSPTVGAEPTSPGVIGAGAPAAPGTLAAVPAPGTPAAAGAQPTAGAPSVLVVTRPQTPTQQAQAAEAGAVGAQGAVGGQAVVGGLGTVGAIAATKVSEIGIKDLDPTVRRQLEQFRIELELFYTFSLSEIMRSQGVTKPASAPLQDR